MHNAHKRAFKRTLIVAFFVLIPFLYVFWAHQKYPLSHHMSVTTPAFLFTTEKGAVITKDHLLSKMSLFVLLNKSANPSSLLAVKNWSDSLQKDFSLKLSEKNTPIQLIAWNPKNQEIGTHWNRITSEENIAAVEGWMSELSLDKDENYILYLDASARIIAFFSEKEWSEERFQQQMSKAMFDFDLFEYLSTRTFFGPKRKMVL